MSEITVYHGSNMEVINPSCRFGRYNADFGCGFYVTRNFEMAEKWAAHKARAIINQYTISLSNLRGIEFDLDKAWLDFICANRLNQKSNISIDTIDYIVWATADDPFFKLLILIFIRRKLKVVAG